MSDPSKPSRDGTGISGLDFLLRGGLPAHRLYVVEGEPGSGKTTMALQFLLDGVRLGEKVLYITLSETEEELQAVAASHSWSLEGVSLLELESLAARFRSESEYTVYHPADVELGETIRQIKEVVERLAPARVALDSVSELKILSETNARYRREILGLKQFFAGRSCTVLVLDDRTNRDEQQLQSIAHGVIRMERSMREYGDTRRRVYVVKMRGVRFLDGPHDFTIATGGILVYPRLLNMQQAPACGADPIKSGVPELDQLLGSGVDRSTSNLVMGPAGCGKSTICTQYALAALERGERVLYYLFEESRAIFLERAEGMSLNIRKYTDSGLLELTQVDPASLSPGEFAFHIARGVEDRGARMVVIDSLNGYLNALPSEQYLLIQMHELLTYLNQHGVVTFLVLAQYGMLGMSMRSPLDVSYLADCVILLRYFEALGSVRQAISVVKKRTGVHEKTIREMSLTDHGIRIGEPLLKFEGVLTGVPRYTGGERPLQIREAKTKHDE